MTEDFAYLNARIRVRLSQMLPEGFFREALRLSFPELVKILGDTIYGPDLTGNDLDDVDRAVEVHLNRTVGDLPRLVSGSVRDAVNLLLVRSDLTNTKTILRGKHRGWTKEEILRRLGSGTVPRALYSRMVEAADAASLAQLLTLTRHPLARALRAAVSTAREPLELEIALDREFYIAVGRQASQLDQPYLVSFLRFEIDALNLATGLKLAAMDYRGDLGRLFLPGGRSIGRNLFETLAAGDLRVLEELAHTDFKGLTEGKDLTAIERGLRCILLAKAREGVKDVLGAGMANHYVLSKEWEAGRIRLLARRATYELPPADVEMEVFCQ
ncbi:MAG: V-type ATPase subunit [Deltaproteobacteria bacterium]|nr:V-type ATPase subunit [Deltaproteobacteria bacterium]